MGNIGKAQKAKASTQGDLDNITTGRKTVKTLLKNTNDTGSMVTKLEAVSLFIFLIIYLFL